jgi:hypothetical protein
MKFIELFFDAETTQRWGITIWDIDNKDFDPMTSAYETLNQTFIHVHEAKKAQEILSKSFKLQGHTVYMNNYNPEAFFWIKPRWLEEMIAKLVPQVVDIKEEE